MYVLTYALVILLEKSPQPETLTRQAVGLSATFRAVGGGHLFAPPVSPKLLDGSVKFKRRSIALSNLSKET